MSKVYKDTIWIIWLNEKSGNTGYVPLYSYKADRLPLSCKYRTSIKGTEEEAKKAAKRLGDYGIPHTPAKRWAKGIVEKGKAGAATPT